jgi:hypothetical protein
VVPAHARARPGDEPCVSLGHLNLGYVEEIDRPRWGTRRVQLVEAVCMECSKPQTEVRIIYPADYTIAVHRQDDQMASPRRGWR